VLLPAPDERPALRFYQEAGQFWGAWLSGWLERRIVEKGFELTQKKATAFAP